MSEQPASEMTVEVQRFLVAHRRVFVLTRRRDGWPEIHPMAGEWRDAALWVNTYRKSQKVINTERDPRASYLVTSDDEAEPFGAVNVRGITSVVESVPGTPGDQRTGVDRPLRPGEIAKRIRLKLDPEYFDLIS